MARRIGTIRSARAPGFRVPTSSRCKARAPPAVADQTASAGVIRIAVTASATTIGMLVVKLVPGLQSVARATVAPASSKPRASGQGERVERSATGTSVATTPASASASASPGQMGQMVGARGPSSAANRAPGPGSSWFAWIRNPGRDRSPRGGWRAIGLRRRRLGRRRRRPTGRAARRRQASDRAPDRRTRRAPAPNSGATT